MTHEEYIKSYDDADTAVLMVHGICSTPRHFDFLIPHIPQGISIYNIRLDGHGKTVADFRRTSMKKWKTQVKSALDMLSQKYENIYIVGYSMGTLLTMEQLKTHPKVKGMLLLNAPLNICTKPVIFWRCTKFCFGRINDKNPYELATFNDIGMALEPWLFKYYLWLPKFLALFRLSSDVRKIASDAKIPIYAFFGEKDELVSIKSARHFDVNTHAKVYKFKDSAHCYYEPDFVTQAQNCLKEMLGAY